MTHIKNHNLFLFVTILLVGLLFLPLQVLSQSATIPINISVNGTLTLTNALDDSNSGKNPNINVNLSVTPDLGATEVSGDANFRIRTNLEKWRLTIQRTQEVDTGPTNIKATDVGLLVTTQVGTNANSGAGKLVSPFNVKTNLGQVPTSGPISVIEGSDKTSKARDTSNTNNYFQVNTNYSIQPDFFYQPGTWKTIVTYNLVSP